MRLMRQVVPAAGGHGGIRKKGEQVDVISSHGGTSESYLLRRLKRDRQDLADKVVAGERSKDSSGRLAAQLAQWVTLN
jgi:hypothetical protein